jgi:hypothetical protein
MQILRYKCPYCKKHFTCRNYQVEMRCKHCLTPIHCLGEYNDVLGEVTDLNSRGGLNGYT